MIEGFTKSQVDNLIEFIELNFINALRNDTDIDNIDYVVDMMDTLTKLRQTRSAMHKEIYQSVMEEKNNGYQAEPR